MMVIDIKEGGYGSEPRKYMSATLSNGNEVLHPIL
jgi:hypothetical protein